MTSPNTNTAKNRSSKTDHANSNSQYSHELEEVVPGGRVSVFADTGKKYFVGVQLATLLKRETFNLYRSMKIKNVGVSRATHGQVSFLVKAGAVRPGTHSVTLVDYETCHAFLRGAPPLYLTFLLILRFRNDQEAALGARHCSARQGRDGL